MPYETKSNLNENKFIRKTWWYESSEFITFFALLSEDTSKKIQRGRKFIPLTHELCNFLFILFSFLQHFLFIFAPFFRDFNVYNLEKRRGGETYILINLPYSIIRPNFMNISKPLWKLPNTKVPIQIKFSHFATILDTAFLKCTSFDVFSFAPPLMSNTCKIYIWNYVYISLFMLCYFFL